MVPQTSKSFSGFTVLTDATDSVAKAKKNYLIWIITVSMLFCIAVAYIYYKTVLATVSFSDQISHSTADPSVATISVPKEPKFKLYNPKPLLASFRQRNSASEFTCEESHPRSQVIPSIYVEQIFRKNFENIQDYIGLDLLLHYDNIINEFRPNYLKSIFNEYQSKWLLVRNSKDFVNFLRILNSNKFKFYADYLKHEALELKIEEFQSYFALTEELNQWYNYLTRLGRFLSSYEQQKLGKYFETCTEQNFKKYTEDTQKRIFRFVYPFNITEKKLEEVNEIISEWGSSPKTEFYNSSVLFYNRVILLSQIKEQLLRLDSSRLKSVYIFASHVVYLDEDVELFGVNLAIIAPKWMFLRKIKINLNGRAGEAITDVASLNEAGKPGNPGGNAGDFLGIGNLHEKFLQVSADGGKGGNGQNGANGRDGMDHTFPAPPVDKPSACAIRIKSFSNAFRQNITHYEIYNVEGCGGRGTDGGVGGIGGEGGVITLIGKEGVNVKKGLKGAPGLGGKGGAGGAGGRNGCFYEVLDVDDEILHLVTRVECPRGNVLPRGDFGKDNYNTRGQIFPPAKENLKVGNSLFKFIPLAGEAFIKYNDADVVLLLKGMNQGNANHYEDVTDIISEYESIKDLNRIEFFNILKEKITGYMQKSSSDDVQSVLKLLQSVVLGEMAILKKNINFFVIDFKNYLNLLKKNIKSTNENTRDFQSISYLKQKVETKHEMIAESLKRMRLSAVGLETNSRYTKQLSEGAEGGKFLCIVVMTIDVLYALLNRPSKDLKSFKSNNVPEFCSVSTKEVDKGSNVLTNLTKEEKNVFTCLENLSKKSKQEIRGNLMMLKEALCAVKESEVFSDGENNLLQALTDKLDHFIALYYFTEWEEVKNLFLKSLTNVTESSGTTGSEKIKFLKSRLVDIMIALQYKLAVDASIQNLNHLINTNSRLHLLQRNTTADDVVTQINHLQDLVDRDTDSFCKNHLKAIFDKDSAVGEFYFWSNEQIKNELQDLFSGAEINLKSNLINRHVFDKNYVQFTSIKLEFECIRNRIVCEKQIHEVLSNFKIEMTHSGYSYYNWKGETHIVVSEKVSLEYSFRKRDNGQPEVYNALFRKCQAGEIKLSPFTTWTIRLLPINDDADFNKLTIFARKVNLRLAGTGTYVS